MNSDLLPRESAAARLKTMLRRPNVVVLDDSTVEVRGDLSPEEAADLLRRARTAAGILGRTLGHVQGRSLVLSLFPVDGAPVCRYPGERATCSFPLCDCPVPRP